jgi:protein-S-isoprenylcysteine O-methyltransferase Ste14
VNWLWWAPLGAATLHIGEEFVYPGGFAAWDRDYRPSIRNSITPRLHFIVNALLLAACATVGSSGMPGAALAVGGLRLRSAVPGSLSVPAWLALTALLFSNAIFHLVGTYQTKRISPGVRTGVLLYVPLAVFGYWHFIRAGQVSPVAAGASALLGGSYHLWAAWAHRWRSRRHEA